MRFSEKIRLFLLFALTSGSSLILTGQVTAQTFTNPYSFTGGSDGGAPYAGLILSGNTLYGTTSAGGSSGNGTVFAVNTDGSGFTNLYRFTGGSDGSAPFAGLILSGNTLFGTTLAGGSSGNGTVFAVSTDGSGFTNLYRFTGGNDGSAPSAGLILSSNILYGTASAGGSSGNGTVFAVNTDGSGFTNLYSFTGGSDGGVPLAGLILSGDTLFGTTAGGGSSANGTVFAVNTDGSGFTNVYSFTGGNDGGAPNAGLILSGNRLFGTTAGGGNLGNGTVFAVNTDGSGSANLHSFTGGNDGAAPSAGLILSGNTLFGTTAAGSLGNGTVFSEILTQPTISKQPADQQVYAGSTATFSVLVGGTPPLGYQWNFNNTNIVDGTNAILTLANVQPANSGVYAVSVSNAYGAIVSSNALLTVLVLPPSIATQPTNQAVYAGDTARFTVVAGGTPPWNYQWIVNATNLVGATNAVLIITNALLDQSGNYSVLVTNAYGSTNSVTVTLTVNPPTPSAGLLPFPLSANQRGTVTCVENPSFTYDIYLPPAYSSHGNPLPIFYTMDPIGGGMVSTFQSICSSLNIICVGITGSKNGRPWIQELQEMYAVTRDIRERVLFDPTAEFAGGLSGGGVCSYMLSRLRGQHVAGVFEMGGWLARFASGPTVQYYGIDRVQTNLLVARTTGTTDTATIFYNPFDSNFLATCDAVVKDWSFSGGHSVPPATFFSPVFSWLMSQRIPAGPSDDTNAFMLYTNWQARIAAGQQESVLRECVSNLMNFPRSWYSYQAQLTLDQLLADYTTFRTLNVSNLAQGDFASDLFFYYAYGAAANHDWPRYNSCMKALTGITVTNDFDGTTTISGITETVVFPTTNGAIYITTANGDRAGDIYFLLTNYNHYPFPQIHVAAVPGTNQFSLWLSKDTPGLAYSVQSNSNLLNGLWPDVPVVAVDTNTTWSAIVPPISAAVNGFYRIKATPSPATSPPWTRP